MTKCLAIDTSTRRFCLGVKNGSDYFDIPIEKTTDHAKEIFKKIDHVLNLAELSMQELDFLAVGIGPGRFSGLGVSISAIKSICYVIKKPIVAISSLEFIAREIMYQNHSSRILLIEDAGRNNLYLGSYAFEDQKFIRIANDQLMHTEEINIQKTEGLIVGSGIKRYPEMKINSNSVLVQSGEEYLNSITMIDHALEEFNKGKTIDCMNLKPNYLFNEVAS